MTAVLGPSGALWFSLGIAGAVMGVFLLVASSLVALIAGSSACSMNTLCATAPELRLIFLATGALLLILGIVSLVHAFQRGAFRTPWMQLPP
jgi:hypothetical protein